MQKLNELVELAKKATPGRNHDRLDSCGGGIKYQCLGDDGSLVLQCDHKNDQYGFIGPKSLEDEAFFLACKPETILAIAAEFRALEQRAESVEAEVQRLNSTAQPVSDGWVNCIDRYPSIGEEVLIRIPVCNKFNIENGKYEGNGQFLGAWFSTRGKGRPYQVTHWMPLPAAPGGQDD